MRDAASAAAMSDPENNRWFKRRWSEDEPVQPPAEPMPLTTLQDLELIGRELLVAWRRERAGQEAGQ